MFGKISPNVRLAVPKAKRPDCPAKVDETDMGLIPPESNPGAPKH
jgi:hypothetical protein